MATSSRAKISEDKGTTRGLKIDKAVVKATQLHAEMTTATVEYRSIVIRGNFIGRAAWGVLSDRLISRTRRTGSRVPMVRARRTRLPARRIGDRYGSCSVVTESKKLPSPTRLLPRSLFSLIRLDTWRLITGQINWADPTPRVEAARFKGTSQLNHFGDLSIRKFSQISKLAGFHLCVVC